ncbi:uncharacterized protein LOC132258498 [Phlebotomus argentipes]|uniref:uncharacterized protein LOC132258498 n=1 Tax=Phlebotomus argentipes TaxID=94469 RepID=UPI002892E1EC|nr:uncharacterized protein LOC132258498 [Phlebotomus argentipes]
MLFIFLLVTALAALILYIYRFGTRNENFFLERGLKFHKPTFLFGNCYKMVRKQDCLYDYIKNLSKDFPNEKMIGHFEFRDPIVIILDPELVKKLAVKEFESFTDHRNVFSEELDPLFGNSMFSMKGQKWKDMRSTLSPAFTGSKMRLMCDLIVEICEQMVDYLKKEVTEKGPQTHEMKEFFCKTGTDIIGTCAFGIKVDSWKAKDNDFYVSASKLFSFSGFIVQMKLLFYRMCPSVMEYLKIPLFDQVHRSFMKNLVVDTMKLREEKNIVRHDMIHLLMEAQKGNLKHTSSSEKDSAGFATVEESDVGRAVTKRVWTEDEIVAQCFLFFLAGFDTSSTLLSFLAYEITANPDVQEKLYQEILKVHEKLDGKPIKYDNLHELKYLDMVISESLRKWAVPFVDRVCTRDITIKYDGDKEYTFRKGEAFWIPIVTYHYNPEFFPHPEKFLPERFSDESDRLIDPATYLPFGIGPRNCIGSRLGLMKIKSLFYYLILNFHLEANEKTQIPIQLEKNFLGLVPEKGIHVQLRSRQSEMSIFWLLVLVIVILFCVYKYGMRKEHFFRDRGVKYHKTLPFVGNSLGTFLRKDNIISHVLKLCKTYRNEKVFGAFDSMTPTLVIQDPDLAKYLAIKEFDHFMDHEQISSADIDPLFSQSLFLLQGHKWREMRATLSPAFTGSKMRFMSEFIVEICAQMVDYLKTEAKEKGPQARNVTDLFSRLATDIIGTCAFGIKVDSLKEKNNKFFTSAKEMFDSSSIFILIKLIASSVCPWLMKLFGITIFGEHNRSFLKDLVLNSMKIRQEKNIIRPDMIHLLIEAQTGSLDQTSTDKDSAGFATVEESQMKSVAKKTSWTDDELVAQCFIFFLAGFDTVSTVLTFLTYEIAKDDQIQKKLYQEATTVRDGLKGKLLTYESLRNLKYLDMVVSEALRIWPPVPSFDRICTKDLTIEYNKGKMYTFHEGEMMWIPVADYHFNPKYFSDPKKFDPERFSDKNKHLINPNTYLPFGIGPRNCIGSRFALMEIKSLIYYLILNFHFDMSDKTEVPVVLVSSFVGLKARSGVWIKFRPRE